MAKMPKELMDLLNERPLVPKVLSTCDATGTLNAVPKETLSAVDEETIAFADIWGDKTNLNLKATSKAAVAVFKIQVPPAGYQVKGTFQGFQTSGPIFDIFAIVVTGIFLGIVLPRMGVAFGALTGAVAFFGYILLCQYFFSEKGWILNLVYPLAVTVLIYVGRGECQNSLSSPSPSSPSCA